ncbi:ATP-binding protein [Sandarakinorhabdus cyanobacteriorum]|nr:ATP-binding protein [Sandarakinorhabdus cyanobacteriorum]
MQFKTEEIQPKASMLIESMRDIGYSLETALADIIDNSIAAAASRIDILVDPSIGNPAIGILDNGGGMTKAILLDAMRPGSSNPRDARAKLDLGRFGLGMKTASFSQCRRLSVLTRRGGKSSAAIWDLDHVASSDRWEILLPADHQTIPFAERLVGDGTLVVWEKLDRILGDEQEAQQQKLLAQRVDEAASHIELVFHRYLSGEATGSKLPIMVNNRPLEPHDPFGTSHKATQRNPNEPQIFKIKGHNVAVQTFTLPHHSKLTDRQYEALAGKAGFLRNQGFYLYREKRLIISGTWFGLAQQKPITQLTRVRIDMPKELDAEWKIDVKKASAQPPPALRRELRGLVEQICSGSKRVYTHRGKKLVSDDQIEIWQRIQHKGQIRYGINPDHPVVAQLSNELGDEGRQRLKALIRLMETSLPIDSIFADKGGNPTAVSSGDLADHELAVVAADTYRHLNGGAEARDEGVLAMLGMMDPFRSNWPVVESALKDRFGWDR